MRPSLKDTQSDETAARLFEFPVYGKNRVTLNFPYKPNKCRIPGITMSLMVRNVDWELGNRDGRYGWAPGLYVCLRFDIDWMKG